MTPRIRASALAVAALLAARGGVAQERPGAAGLRASDAGMERVTLEEAIRRATAFDPDYIQALGRTNNASWARTAALTQFVLPSIQATGSFTKFSSEFFNIGTAQPATQIFQTQIQANLPLFAGGARIAELKRAGAEQDASASAELQALYQTALDAESAYYDVLAGLELAGVAAERVTRAEEQLVVARARVTSGAAVQTDSLQLLLELTRARVDLLQQEAALRVARFELGRVVGSDGPVDAATVDMGAASALPLTETEAVAEALRSGPDYQTALAEERAAGSALSVRRAGFSPQVSLFGSLTTFDERFFPDAVVRSSGGVSVSIPIWNGGQREVQLAQARNARDVARARREDIERSVRRDVVQAYAAYETARASAELADQGVTVATENLRVQESRYQNGATTILDLITAQVDLADAEAGRVQARYATRLALAGLEAILGRRLSPDRVEPEPR